MTKKLIEVAMPVKEISAESVRDKSIRHGHISTLHLWWARRPLPVCRAVVFASLVPDPLDENCQQAFKDAVDNLLGKKNNPGDPYKPYDDIPWTAIIDPMEDNLRNRLLMFIGKFSPKYIENELTGKETPAKDKLDSHSLIKWDNKNNEEIINKARKLIWVAHNLSGSEIHDSVSATELLNNFDSHYAAIKQAETELYNTTDRHIETPEVKEKEKKVHQAIESFLNRMPKVFDPFAGGGAIPLEAARLGCRSYGNDINPVAHIIQKGSVEFPQKYGKPILYNVTEFEKLYGREKLLEYCLENDLHIDNSDLKIKIPNRLAFDVEFYAKKLLKMTEKSIGYLYPADEKGNKPIAYLWARTIKCSNPTCQYEIPLVGTKYLVRRSVKKIAFKLIENPNSKSFDIEIKQGSGIDFDTNGTVSKSKATCPHCGSINDTSYLKETSKTIGLGRKMIAIIKEGKNGKKYELPTERDITAAEIDESLLNDLLIPNEPMLKIPDLVSGRGWGVEKWRDLFSSRQLLAMQTLVEKLNEIKMELNPVNNHYNKALMTYLGIWVDRLTIVNTSYGRWNVSGEKIEHPFSRQAIPFIFDFPESNLFSNSTGSARNQLSWVVRYIENESSNSFGSICNNSASGELAQFSPKSLDAVVTDPPYYDAIAYADLSDFFYVWLKRTIGDMYPMNLAFPQTPKTEECTALKHHHEGSAAKAEQHFEIKLLQIFDVLEKQTRGLISIMFAHQSTNAWTTLCNSILGANMNITSSWAIDTEMGARMIALGNAALESSVTVSCLPSKKKGYGSYKEVKIDIEKKIKSEVKDLNNLGFRGADLLTACFGQAVSEFGKYEKVEKADGSEVQVAELLDMAREAAFNAIISDIETDDFTKFYIGWINLFGFSQADHDDVRRITQIGLNIDVRQILSHHILVREGNKQTLASCNERVNQNNRLGEQKSSFTLDKVHKAMALFKGGNRSVLVNYIGEHGANAQNSFWRVLNSLVEILPAGSADHKQAAGLLANKDSLIRETKSVQKVAASQLDLDLE